MPYIFPPNICCYRRCCVTVVYLRLSYHNKTKFLNVNLKIAPNNKPCQRSNLRATRHTDSFEKSLIVAWKTYHTWLCVEKQELRKSLYLIVCLLCKVRKDKQAELLPLSSLSFLFQPFSTYYTKELFSMEKLMKTSSKSRTEKTRVEYQRSVTGSPI